MRFVGEFFLGCQFRVLLFYVFTMKFRYPVAIAGAVLLSAPGVWGTEWVTSEKLQNDILEVE